MAVKRTVRNSAGQVVFQDAEPISCGQAQPALIVGGVGTELKKLLATFGLAEVPGCRCRQRAAEMDWRGIDWCEENKETILGWLKEEADRRKLPWLEFAARLAIDRAIAAAKRAAIPPLGDLTQPTQRQ